MKYICLIWTSLVLLSCNPKTEQQITRAEDYNRYLASAPAKTTSKYFELWNSKIKPDSMQLTSFSVVAAEYNRYFQETGAIDFLKKSEQALTKAVDIAAIGKPQLQRALARNYISQHRFREALQLAEDSYNKGNGLKESRCLLFDIHMELGNYERAERYLDSIANSNDFDYLIRKAKWQDHQGYLEDTIAYMEQAKYKAEGMKNRRLMSWSYTNLGDYYGHAGRISDAYRHYIKALQLEPQNAYAQKGIAWIAFSHEKNPEEALRILASIGTRYTTPDHSLLKAEIAQYMGDPSEQAENLQAYSNLVANAGYGMMYNAHTIDLYLQNQRRYGEALALAQQEVSHRPTPESFSLLAASYLKMGEKAKALTLVQNHIEGKTFEPAVLHRVAEIYKANGLADQVAPLKEELLEAAFELGPVAHHEITGL